MRSVMEPSTKAQASLNESPSKKEGKLFVLVFHARQAGLKESLHLKVQNKRSRGHLEEYGSVLIESPSKKEGKSVAQFTPITSAGLPQ